MEIVNLSQCPDGQHIRLWIYKDKLWSDTIRVVDGEITEIYQEFIKEDDELLFHWTPANDWTFDQKVQDTVRYVINESSI